MSDVYEPTDDDRAAASAQAERIAQEIKEYVLRATDDKFLYDHELADIIAAKVEAAILAEMAMRGAPLAARK